jgi:hypothetical protein
MTDPEKAVALLGSGWVRPMHRVLGGALPVVVLAESASAESEKIA